MSYVKSFKELDRKLRCFSFAGAKVDTFHNMTKHSGKKTMLLMRPWERFFLNFLSKFSLQVDSLRHLSGDLTRQNNVKK